MLEPDRTPLHLKEGYLGPQTRSMVPVPLYMWGGGVFEV